MSRFSTVQMWKPVTDRTMQETDDTYSAWVRYSDYLEVLREVQHQKRKLKRAGELIGKLTQEAMK